MRISVVTLVLCFCVSWNISCRKQDGSALHLSAQVFKTEAGYGYDIYQNGNRVIHQAHIPVIAGEKGFRSEDDALQAAQLMMLKMEKGKFPPTLTQHDLDSLSIVP